MNYLENLGVNNKLAYKPVALGPHRHFHPPFTPTKCLSFKQLYTTGADNPVFIANSMPANTGDNGDSFRLGLMAGGLVHVLAPVPFHIVGII